MPETPAGCRQCGQLIARDAPGGLCPACLLRAGWEMADQTPLKIRCPHCQGPVEILDSSSLSDITCPSCDTHFSLVADAGETLISENPQVIGRFEILAELGEGAFGKVWKARDRELDRIVAIKIPRRGTMSAGDVEKFLREARSAAQLRHPQIVSVHEAGRDGEVLYIVSDLIDGPTLADVFSTRRLALPEAARMCEQIARALDHAHRAGVIHRDIKPSNILLDRAGNPHVTDFGLAKRDAAEITMTLDGQILGTPAYMSPEQARGDAHAADARSDVYSLGVVLYEMLAGEKPFRGTTRMVLHQVLEDAPQSPRILNPLVPPDLETICLKCLEKEPGRRYPNAAELADDLSRFLAGRPIAARPVSPLEHLWRWARRNPVPAALTSGLVLAILLGMAGIVWQWRNALAQQRTAEISTMQYREELQRLTTANGSFALEQDAPLRALSWFARGLEQAAGDPGRSEMHRRRIGAISRQLPRLARVLAGDFGVQGAQLSPRGEQVAIWGATRFQLWNVATGGALAEPIGGVLQIAGARYRDDGRRIAIMRRRNEDDPDSVGEVSIVDAATGRLMFAPLPIAGLCVECPVFVDGGRTLAVAGNESLFLIDCETGNRRTISLPLSGGMWVEATPDGRRVLVCCGYYEVACTVLVVDAVTGEVVGRPVEEVEVWTSGRHVSRDGRYFATWAYDPTGGRASGPSYLQLWKLETGEPAGPRISTVYNVSEVHFPQSRPVVIAHLRNRALYAWNLETHEPVPLHAGAQEGCRRFAFSPDESRLALDRVEGDHADVLVVDPWDSSQSIVRFSQSAGGLLWSPDGQQLVVDASTEWHLIDLPSRERRVLDATSRRGDEVIQFSSQGNQLLTLTLGGVARVWDLTSVRPEIRLLEGNPQQDNSTIELSPSGDLVAIGGGPTEVMASRSNIDSAGEVRVWNWRTGEPAGPAVKLPSRASVITFGADDQRLVVVTDLGTAMVLDPLSGRLVQQVGETESPVAAAALSAAGELIVYRSGVAPHAKGYSPSFDKAHARLEFWSLEQVPRMVRSVPLATHEFCTLSRDGSLCLRVTGGDAAVINTTTGVERKLAEMHGRSAAASFSGDGSRVVIVSIDGLAKIWNCETGDVIASAWEGVELARFAGGDRFLLTFFETSCQVWDALTVEPISLPFTLRRVKGAQFSPGLAVTDRTGDHLLTVNGNALIDFHHAPDTRTGEAIVAEIQAASGYQIDARGGYSPRSSADQARAAAARRDLLEENSIHPWQPAADWHDQSARLSELDLQSDRWPSPSESRGHWYSVSWHLQRLVTTGGRPSEASFRLGRALVELGEFEQAEAALQEALQKPGEAPGLWSFVEGRALAGLNRTEAAILAVARGVEAGYEPPPEVELPRWAKVGLVRGLTGILQKNPTDLVGLEKRARLSWELCEWANGLRDFEQLTTDGPAEKQAWFHTRRGDCLAGLGRLDEAIRAYTQALGSEENDPTILDARAGAAALIGRFDAAISDLEKAKTLWSNPYEPTMHSALVHLLANRRDGYERELAAAVEPVIEAYGDRWTSHLPDDVANEVVWLAALGPITSRTDQYLELANNVARRSPGNRLAIRARAAMSLARNETPAAEQVLAELEKLPEAESTLWLLKGLAHKTLGQAAELERCRERAAETVRSRPMSEEFPWTTVVERRVLERRLAAPEAQQPE